MAGRETTNIFKCRSKTEQLMKKNQRPQNVNRNVCGGGGSSSAATSCLGFKLAQIEISHGLASSHAATAATWTEPVSGSSTDHESANCSTAPALLNVRDYKGLRCSLPVYWLALPMHHAGFSRHALWLGTNPSPNTVVLSGKIWLRHCFSLCWAE